MNIYQTDYTKTPEIFLLIKEHKNEDAKEYLKQNPSEIFLKGWMDDTPLHIASLSGNFDMVQFLVENGANVNAERSGIYATPLCWADNYEIAKYLLDNGATMNDLELYLATGQDKIEVVDLLLSRGARIDTEKLQYLACKSIECIKVYLNHNIRIDGQDKQSSNLLHKLSWLDLPDVFDFAYENGCPWQKDSSQRTPYYLAKQGHRENILKHFKEKYCDLISHKIKCILTANYKFERIFFLMQSPVKPEWFIGLTGNAKLIKYKLSDGELLIDRVAAVDVSSIRNFTFDKQGNIIIPTADNELLIVDQTTFELINTVDLPEDLELDQIKYLPLKNIYIGSQGWEIIILSEDFKVINRVKAVDGIMLPCINQNESLISFLSYDQTTYYNLYSFGDDLSITFIHTFFKDWDNTSSDFSFNKNEFAVTFTNTLEYYLYEDGLMHKQWELDISKYKSEYGLSYLTFVNENTIALGKGKMLLYIDISDKIVYREIELKLSAEIRDLYLDNEKEYLLVSTDRELKAIRIEEEKNQSRQSISERPSDGFLSNIYNKLKRILINK